MMACYGRHLAVGEGNATVIGPLCLETGNLAEAVARIREGRPDPRTSPARASNTERTGRKPKSRETRTPRGEAFDHRGLATVPYFLL